MAETNKIEKKETAKKHSIRIPIDPLNPKDVEVIVGVNGKYAKIIRGKDTEVEDAVYEVLKTANLI